MFCEYTGISDFMLKLVEECQLKDRDLWELTVQQYAGASDDADLGWRGEYWGKLMRGACMTWQYSRDEELYDILTEAVEKLLHFQEPDGRISTYGRETEFRGWDIWCRKYVLLGLLHYYEICQDEGWKCQVLEAACRHLDYIVGKIGRGEGKQRITETSHIWDGINSSSILEPVVKMYRNTGKQEYLDFASYIVEEGGAKGFDIFRAAYEDQLYPYEYKVVKAYELMSCFEGLAEYAETVKEEKWRAAVVHFADRLLVSEKTVSGGSGCLHELFNHSSVMQTDPEYEGLMLETCVTVTWMKFLYRVYEMTGNSIYLDELECSAYNALYGAVNTEGATCGAEAVFDKPEYRQIYDACMKTRGGRTQIFDSYSPLLAGIRGRAVGGFQIMRGGTAFYGCCMAIGAAGTALVPKASVRETGDGFEIGLYLPGRVKLQLQTPKGGEEQVEAEICTKYPVDGDIRIRLKQVGERDDFTISLRIPSFSDNSSLWVNGTYQDGVKAGDFFRICRHWKEGDEIVLSLDMNPRVIFGTDRDEGKEKCQRKEGGYAAMLYGPVTLARDRRLGKVGTPVCLRKSFEMKPYDIQKIPFPCQTAFEVSSGGEKFLMVDYASAGKTWNRESEMETWMPVR